MSSLILASDNQCAENSTLNAALLLTSSARIAHQLYRCPLYVWLAEGCRRLRHKGTDKVSHLPEKCFWLYIEYRNKQGCCRYSQFVFKDLESVQQFLDGQLGHESLHEINPSATRTNPVGVTGK